VDLVQDIDDKVFLDEIGVQVSGWKEDVDEHHHCIAQYRSDGALGSFSGFRLLRFLVDLSDLDPHPYRT
jgi:hypothetical protein